MPLFVTGLMLLPSFLLHADSRIEIREETYKTQKVSAPAFLITTRYYTATLVPELGGRILALIDAKDGKNLVYDNGYGGLLDDHGSRIFLPYQLTWIKKTPQVAIAKLVLDEEVRYEKILTFYADRPCIEVMYRCENHGQTDNRMLFRNVVRPGGETFSDEELYCSSRKTGLLRGKNLPYRDEPADMWAALIHPSQQRVVANFFEGNALQRLYSWRKGIAAVAPTYEFLFEPLKPGQETEFHYYWMICHGLTAADYAHKNFVAQIEGSYTNETLSATLSLVPTWLSMPDLKVSMEILDSSRNSIRTLPSTAIGLSHLDTLYTLPISTKNLKEDSYVILLLTLQSSTLPEPLIIEKPFPRNGEDKLLAKYTRPVRWVGNSPDRKNISGWKKETDYTVQPNRADQQRGYLVFEENGAGAGKHTSLISFDLAQLEPEGFPLHFYSISAEGSVRIGQTSPKGILLESFIPESMPIKGWTGEERAGLKLIPGDTFTIKPGEDRTLFFRLTSGEIKPGKYSAKLRFTPEKGASSDITVAITIHPIRFPSQPIMVFDANNNVTDLCTRPGKNAQNPVWDQVRADNYMKDMKNHGIRGHNMPGVSSPFSRYWYNRVKVRETGLSLTESIAKYPERFRNRTDLPSLDFSEWDWFTDQFLRAGMTHFRVQMGSCGERFMSGHAPLTRLIYGTTLPSTDIRQTLIMEWYNREAVRYMKDRGILRVFAIIDDEIPSEKLAWWVQHAFRASLMGFEPGVTQSAATIADDTIINMVSPFMKYWVIGTLQKDMMDLRRAEGLIRPEDRTITYHSSAVHWQKYDQMRGKCGLESAFFDLDACWIQAYDRFYSTEHVVYPGPDGPISSAAWEGARDGLDDANYLLLARAMISALPKEEQKTATQTLESIVGMKEDSLIRFSNRVSGMGMLTLMGSIQGKAFRPYKTYQFREAKARLLSFIETLAPKVPTQKASALLGLHSLIQEGTPSFIIPERMQYKERAAQFLRDAAKGLECADPVFQDPDPNNPYPIFFFGRLEELKKDLPLLASHPDLQDVDEKYPGKGNYLIRFLQKPPDPKAKAGTAQTLKSMVILVGDEEGATRAEKNLSQVITFPKSQYSHWLVSKK